MASFIILCEKELKEITKPENVSAPQADPHPIVAGSVLGTYASAEIAERALMRFNCDAKHYIVKATHWSRLKI